MKLAWLALAVGALAAETPDFATRVQPRLVKAGCFSGACHGAGSGQNGFKLSLLGYDAEADYRAIVYQFRGRRVNLVRPEDSLLLKKATFELAHGGGKRFPADSETYRTALEWLRGGAPYESAGRRRITALKITPAASSAARKGERVALRLTAAFSDGSQDDATAYALYWSNDDAIAKVDETGIATVNGAGETAVTARYMGLFATARVGLPFAGDPGQIERATPTAASFIDRRINHNLRRLRLLPSPQCTDSEFLRRAHLDILGTLPTVEEARAFLESREPDKRRSMVTALLERPEYADYWSLWLLDLFRLQSKNIGERHVPLFAGWLKDQLRADASFAQIARAMLTSTGDAVRTPALNFLRANDNPKLLGELATESLMGSRSRCAQCHDHPFDSWTQTQYHQFVSFFVRVNRTEDGIKLADHGEIEHPKTGKRVEPGFPDGKRAVIGGEDRRPALADWLVEPGNRYFARSIANRVWARLMGRGLIEPVDDLSASNAPTNPELLADLADFFQRGYSLKSLIREIANSAAYQRSAQANPVNAPDDRFYSRALAAPLGAYALADAISQATGVPEPFGKLPLGVRAIQVADSNVESYLLDVCGRCPREASCDLPNAGAGGVRQMLHFMNGPAIQAKIAAAGGRLDRLRSQKAAPEAMVEEFYLAALSRPPSGPENDYWLSRIAAGKDPGAAMEDLIWGLLNSRAFVFNR